MPSRAIATARPHLCRILSTIGDDLDLTKGRGGDLARGRASADEMTKVHRVAGLRISRVEPTIRSSGPDATGHALHAAWKPRDDLPDLEPPEPTEEHLRQSKRQIFSSDMISLTHGSAMEDVFEPNEREEHKDRVARATVYVLNGIVAVLSLPIGLALLAFNILGGENLRTTAHVIALTGMGTALAQTDNGIWLLGMF